MTINAKAKGSRFEREVALRLGGKRTPLSGGTGGGDITLPHGSIWRDWSWECKRRAKLPALLEGAFAQAEHDVALGDWRKPAVALRADQGRTVVCLYLDDFVSWAEALAETGNGAKLREALRVLERDVADMKGLVR